MIISNESIQASAHYCVLRRGGPNAADLLVIYVALVRSVLEYCCVVWHNALPAYLSSEIERVQKRALRIFSLDPYNRKPYNLLKWPDLKTGAMNSV